MHPGPASPPPAVPKAISKASSMLLMALLMALLLQLSAWAQIMQEDPHNLWDSTAGDGHRALRTRRHVEAGAPFPTARLSDQ